MIDQYKLVPVEPTQAMLDAAGMCIVPEGKKWLDDSNRETWAAMLAAAPEAPQPAKQPLTTEEIYECERIAAIRHHRHKNSIRGQQLTPADDPQWHFANAIIAAYERKNGIGEQP